MNAVPFVLVGPAGEQVHVAFSLQPVSWFLSERNVTSPLDTSVAYPVTSSVPQFGLGRDLYGFNYVADPIDFREAAVPALFSADTSFLNDVKDTSAIANKPNSLANIDQVLGACDVALADHVSVSVCLRILAC